MTRAIAIVVLVFASGMAGCEAAAPSSPTLSPSPIPQTPPAPPPVRRVELAVFTDPTTGFATSDVHDVHGQIVHFNTGDELVWIANDARFPEFIVDGMFISYHHKGEHFFQVRFGTRDGNRRAYLSWPDARRTIVDLWVDERGDLKIAETAEPVPGT